MAFASDVVLDAGLQVYRDRGQALYVCSQEPTTYTAATSTHALGNKTGLTISAQANYTGAGGGRKVEVATFLNGSVTANGTATHWALVDNTGTTLLATGSFASAQALTSGNDLKMNSPLELILNDATAA